MDHPLAELTNWFVDLPRMRCPTCSFGHLRRVKEFVTHESAASQRVHSNPDWDPTWVRGVFHRVLVCAHSPCNERVVVAGDFRLADDRTGTLDVIGHYLLTYARPPLDIVTCPKRTPEAIRAATRDAAEVIWADPSGAAGRLRVAVEELLNARKVRKFGPAKAGMRGKRLTTDARIRLFAAANPDVADVLMAVKWIGNSGAHESGLSTEDVLEGAQMLTHALHLIYDPSQAELAHRVKMVNQRKGPAPRRPATAARPKP
ncbi:hypothetical protein BJ973_000083 [Actinoplanes tereljensis]|uniref:DUF4145 domain-containing protein n=1 Tax=Paractinoplanes tereljensis TaxID=571912 RepID=A0A919U009_9ACTN|nr:DUF4145 domain-containing protein [Actinoplanes tereljensis]GIF26825.1 hypothetical protein Ate02nite_95550 [Actinoplanes tereljensis]